MRFASLPLGIVLFALTLLTGRASAAEYRTVNFTVVAPTAESAKAIGTAAEEYRQRLAKFWFGKAFPKWSRPCLVTTRIGTVAASGETRFIFDDGEVTGWRMTVQGSQERILDSVIPHEVNHTIFASYFREPLPRWLDEGASSLFEHPSEKRKLVLRLRDVVNTSQWVPFAREFDQLQYPKGSHDLHLVYAEGYATVDYLIQSRGTKVFVQFTKDGLRSGWLQSIRKHYGTDVAAMERAVKDWTRSGNPDLDGVSKPPASSRSEVTALYFSEEYCEPCRRMKPVFEALKRRYPLRHADFASAGQRYKVTRIPTVVFFRNGKEVDRLAGVCSEKEIVRRFSSGRDVVHSRYRPPLIFGGYPHGYRPLRMRDIRRGNVTVTQNTQRCGNPNCPNCNPRSRRTSPHRSQGNVACVRTIPGPEGPRGPAGESIVGPPGRPGEVDYDRFAELFYDKYRDKLRGENGIDGRDGQDGVAGPRGLVGVPDDEDIRNWLIGASSDPETRQMFAEVIADIVSQDSRVADLIRRLEALESGDSNAVDVSGIISRIRELENTRSSRTDVTGILTRIEGLEERDQRVMIVDGKAHTVLDDETYKPGEPIVLDIRRLLESAK